MTFRVSLFSKGVIASDFKRFWWVGALYCLVLLLILPFWHLMYNSPTDNRWTGYMLRSSLDIFSHGNGLQVVLICTIPIILSVLLFNYLHNGRAAAVLHSLPLDRKTLFWSHSIAGLVLLLLPVLATGLVLLALNITTYLKEYYAPLSILRWMGLTALTDTLMFSIAVFVGMFTGNTAAHVAFTYILQVLPSGLYVLLAANLRYLVYGYASVNNSGNLRYNFPLMMFANGTTSALFTAGTVAAYLLATAFFLTSANYVYRLRHAETAGEIIAFPILRPVFKYGVTACAMLLAGAYFASAYKGTFPIIVLGYVLGSLLGYLTAEALLQKSLKVWWSYRGYLGYAAVMAVLLLGIATDATGYVHRIPAPEKVKKVYFGTNIGEWMRQGKIKDTKDQGENYSGCSFFEDRNNIKNIILLHRQLLQSSRTENKNGIDYYIAYTLNNGSYLIRQYCIDVRQYASLLKPVYESLEYKKARFPVLTQNPAEIKMIEIGDQRTSKRPAILADRAEIGGFVARLKQDVLSTTFEEITADRGEYMYIDIVDTAGKSVNYTLRPSYKSVIDWLEEKGYYEKIMLLPEEIEYAVLNCPVPAEGYNNGSVRAEIRDRRLIMELLNIYGPDNYTGPGDIISVTFFGRTSAGSFQFNRTINRTWPVSKALKEYLKQLD